MSAARPGRRTRRADACDVGSVDGGWTFARRISPRPRVRLADVDPAGRPVNSYPSEIPLDGPAPDRPYAVYLADAAGRCSLLGFDLDPRHGPVTEDLDELRNLLARAARLPSLDIAPPVNPATGCLRPPGAPHRLTGASRPLAGHPSDLLAPRAGPAQLHALLALLGAPPAAPRPSAGRAVCRDATGAPHLHGDPCPLPARIRAALETHVSRSADASAALWTVLLGAAHARWRLADLTPLLPTAPGLEHARTARAGPLRAARSPAAARGLLARQWGRAVAHVAAGPSGAGADATFPARAEAVVAAVHAAQARADAAPGRWARPGGPADRRVLDALCGQLLAAVRGDVELDVRRLGDLTGVSRETARRALHRLAADGWVIQAGPADGVRAARWSLPPPPAATSTMNVDSGVSQALPRPAGERSNLPAWQHRIGRRLADVAHDAFTPTPDSATRPPGCTPRWAPISGTGPTWSSSWAIPRTCWTGTLTGSLPPVSHVINRG